MPHLCSFYGCKGNYPTGEKVSVFQFPSDEELKKIWASRTKRKDFIPTKNSRVCELHFRREDIIHHAEYFDERTGRLLTYRIQRPRLREGAVPVPMLYTNTDLKDLQESSSKNSERRCFVPSCNHSTFMLNKKTRCKFFKFPTDKNKNVWIKKIKSKEKPTKHSQVCSCHFEKGNKRNGPTIFEKKKIGKVLNDLQSTKSPTTEGLNRSILTDNGEIHRITSKKAALQTNFAQHEVVTPNLRLSTPSFNVEDVPMSSSNCEETKEVLDESCFIIINGAIRRRRPSDEPPNHHNADEPVYEPSKAEEKDIDTLLDDYLIMLKKQKIIV